MATQTIQITFNSDNSISVDQEIVTVNAGDTFNFQFTNNSGTPESDWGLFFNNPFSLGDEKKYSHGQDNGSNLTIQPLSANVPMYSAYLVYVQVGSTYYTKDPEIIVNNGDINN